MEFFRVPLVWKILFLNTDNDVQICLMKSDWIGYIVPSQKILRQDFKCIFIVGDGSTVLYGYSGRPKWLARDLV